MTLTPAEVRAVFEDESIRRAVGRVVAWYAVIASGAGFLLGVVACWLAS